jgi:hypothetical protein
MIVESLSCFRQVGYKDFLVSALVALARAQVESEPARSARLLGAARMLRAPLGPSQFVWESDWAESTEAQVRARLGASRTDAELAVGASDPEAVVDDTLEGAASDPAS